MPKFQLVAAADGYSAGLRRWHRLSLFRDDSHWSANIDYCTLAEWDSPRSFCQIFHADDKLGVSRWYDNHSPADYVRGLRPIGADKESVKAREKQLDALLASYGALVGQLLSQAGFADDPAWDDLLYLSPAAEAKALDVNANVQAEGFTELVRMLREVSPVDYDGPPPPSQPSDLPPGSAVKLDLMEARAASGMQVFHPDEAPSDSYARILEVARNGRLLRVGMITEGTPVQEEDDEVEMERIVSIEEARHRRDSKRRKAAT